MKTIASRSSCHSFPGEKISSLAVFLALAFAPIFFAKEAIAQVVIYPDTVWVRVIFYDHHADGRDTDFCGPSNTTCNCIAPTSGMVQNTLSSIFKPLPTAEDCPVPINHPCACHMNSWYRPSATGGPDTACQFVCDSSNPKNPRWYWTNLIPYLGRANDWTGPNFNPNWKNCDVVIYDSLPFLHSPNLGGAAMYQYNNTAFFLLDNRGFGIEQPPASYGSGSGILTHNFGFGMEIHTKFRYEKGQSFSFMGDDDLWVWINGRLEMDLGGVHASESRSFNLDTIPGMDTGKIYSFDMFYNERRFFASEITVTTNILFCQPRTLNLHSVSNDTLTAGDTLTLVGTITDQDNQIVRSASDSIRWVEQSATQKPGDKLFYFMTDTNKFTATSAYRHVVITGAYWNNNVTFVDTISIYVKPAKPDHLVIESSPSPLTVSPNSDNALGGASKLITLGPLQQTDSGWAVVRDRFQNFVEFSTNAAWSSSDTGVVKASAGTPSVGEGIFTERDSGIARVKAADTVLLMRDSITVLVSPVTYDSLRIMRFNLAQGMLVRIDSLSVSMVDSATLYVQGLRHDRLGGNGGWVTVSGNWAMAAALHTTRLPPQNQNSWTFSPSDTGHGTITVTLPGNAVPGSVWASFLPGPPNSIAIFPQSGPPSTANVIFPAVPTIADSVTAGVVYTKLYAKLFYNNIWLPNYEDSLPLEQQITWTVSPLAKDSLANLNGNNNQLKSTIAYRAVTVTASLGPMSSSAVFWIKPGAVNHLVIEASSVISSLTADQPMSQVLLTATDSSAFVFAILRDAFGNFVNYSKATTWTSTVPSVAVTDTGENILGEGVILRAADSGQATVIACNTTYNLCDSVLVNVNNIYYTNIRIYILNPLQQYPDTVQIATDSSLTLYAEGQRSDGRGWDRVPVTWSLAGGLKTRAMPSSAVDNWSVLPDSIGSGWIKASRVDKPGILADSIYAIFLPGKASRIALYRRAGVPTPTNQFPQIDTLVSESTDTLVAAIFDRNGEWLSQYESAALSQGTISWAITKVSGPGAADSLSTKTGYITTFKPKQAYALYSVIARFISGTTFITDSASIYVVPGSAAHLVIEASPNIQGTPGLLVGAHPIDTITFGPGDTLYSAYAVLRDLDMNYVSMSSSTIWNSLNNLVVTAQEYVPQYGQGLITRVGTTGMATSVIAIDRLNLNLCDTVAIMLDSIPFSGLRIIVQNGTPIQALSMPSDHDTTLVVQANRKGTWINIQGNWSYIGTSSPLTAANLNQWLFAPGDTGTGKIIVTSGSSLRDTIAVCIGPGSPAAVILYNSVNFPGTGNPVSQPLPGPNQIIPWVAGDSLLMAARVVDHRGVYLHTYDYDSISTYARYFKWYAVDRRGDSMNIFLDPGRDSTPQHFTPQWAYDSVYVGVTFTFNALHQFRDTAQVAVQPGPATHLILEKSQNYDPRVPNPCDLLYIQSNQQSGSVYGILRDAYQNAILPTGYATLTTIGSRDTATVGVRLGNTSIGELVAFRNAQQGSAEIYGIDLTNHSDSCMVSLLAYGYDSLRIIAGADSIPHHHGILSITDNDSAIVRVQGKRSDREGVADTGAWVSIPATWVIAPNISTVVPGNGHHDSTFTLSPIDTGTGWIRVTLGNDSATIPDTLQLHITPGAPVAASMQIITPADSLIAGRAIKAVVIITDKNGNPVRMPITYDTVNGTGAFYHDTLGRGGSGRPEPFLVTGGTDTIFLDRSPAAYGKENFVNGVDTLTFTLFYAAGNDSAHQITATLKGSKAAPLVATTAPFTLLPAAIKSIRLEYPNGIPYPDTVNVSRNDTLTIFSRGFDQYGNLTGDVLTKWSVTSPLPPPTDTTNLRTSAIYIGNQSPQDAQGYLIATYSGSVTLADSLYIFVKGPPVMLIRALTRDLNGNGLLDHIVMKFNRAVQLPNDTAFLSGISVNSRTTIFYPDSILGAGTRTDSIWILAMEETVGATQGQTGWTLSVTIPSDSNINLAGSTISTNDSAGPVIWKVTKLWVSSMVHDSDLVTVTFSEPVQINGAVIPQNTAAGTLFNVWGKPDSSDSNFLNTATLAGIPALYSANDTQAVIRMSNDSNVTEKQYFNIVTGNVNSAITDNFANPANANNRKCPVLITGSPTAPLGSAPNPMRPGGAGSNSGAFNLVNDPNYQSAPTDHGTIFSFGVPITQTMQNDVYVQASIKIYDVLGNMVTAATNPQFVRFDGGTNSFSFDGGGMGLTPTQVSGNIAHVYWNGVNGHGMTIAPGIYRVVVDLHYADLGSGSAKQFKDQRSIANLGVRR